GTLGLNLLSRPSDPRLDLIFVHGLGGGSTKTWCRAADPTLFWPKAWLPREPGFQNVRIHSYGYDADWTTSKASSTINIHDFGRQLLERLRNSPELAGPRTCPIMFVAHSMGGLVVKQAYVLARQDPGYVDFAKRIEAMLFMSTPHRGSNLAQTLNSILHAAVSQTPRAYISNLSQQNELLSLLNDSFRHYASDLSLYSFCESRPTDLYLRSETIVAKESAILGYPNERYSMLDADHRSVCKFESHFDSNYRAVAEVLRNMTERILERVSSEMVQEAWRAMQQIESYLSNPASPEDDLKDVEEARMNGSCEWFAERDAFQCWVDSESDEPSTVYWVSANPATGKSVLSGYVINTLTSLNLDCSYYFFRHGDKDKSTVSGFLRSLLYQMALRDCHVRQQLLTMIEKTLRFNKDDAKVIWRKLVWPLLSRAKHVSAQYWVLDALDECENIEPLFSMMASLEKHFCIRILITSRKLPEIAQRFVDLKKVNSAVSVNAEEVSLDNTKVDIRLYLEGNRYNFHVGNEDERNNFMNEILDKSEGCFLWVRLVLDELAQAWSVGEVRRILDEVPREMDPLYSRALKIISSRSKPNRDLAHAILTWVICAVRPLTVAELREALKLDLSDEVPELEMAISSLCAQLIHVDKMGRAMIVHLTAQTFLTNQHLDSEFRVNEKLGHLRLATTCLRFLCSNEMKVVRGRRSKWKQNQAQFRSPLTRYACLEFAEHLRYTPSGKPMVSRLVYKFLDDNALSWIEFVASTGNLSVLTKTANSIKSYVQRHIQSSSPLGEFVHLTQNWVVDLHRIVAGFGTNLLTYPSSIYWLIPPFCPKTSAIASAAASRFKRIVVKGINSDDWDDRMACIDSHDKTASAVACGDTTFAVGHNTGCIVLYHNSTCLPWATLEHLSPIRSLLFNGTDTHLLSAGRRDIKLWDITTGYVLWTAEVNHDLMSLAITEDRMAVTATDKGNAFSQWNIQYGSLERTLNWGEGMAFSDEIGFRRPPFTAALSPDSSLIAVVYRGRPICLYDLDDEVPHGQVSREGNPDVQGLGSMTSPSSLVFNTKVDNHTLAVAYEDGDLCLFNYEDLELLKTIEEANAYLVACSMDGLTLATGNSAGMVQLLEFDTLQLLYRVNADDHGIRALAFSADNLRFLDVRGSQCNVWEPAVLGLAKRERDDSSTEPEEWGPIVKGIEAEGSDITSLAIDHTGQFFFFGRSDGSLSVCDTSSGERQKVLYRHSYQLSITYIVWGSEQNIIATSDTACRFIVWVVLPDKDFGWRISAKLLDRRADSKVHQLFLNPGNDLLLVSTEKSNNVWNIRTKQL
ncbi:hypothetical protein K491DRAFT_550850, partial [Lophiostoma macrostomum CBS 122681]